MLCAFVKCLCVVRERLPPSLCACVKTLYYLHYLPLSLSSSPSLGVVYTPVVKDGCWCLIITRSGICKTGSLQTCASERNRQCRLLGHSDYVQKITVSLSHSIVLSKADLCIISVVMRCALSIDFIRQICVLCLL